MTITNTTTFQTYTGTGAQLLFSIPFDYQLEAEVTVYLAGVLQTVVTHYTLTDSGGNPTTPNDATHVKFVLAPALNAVVEILRVTSRTQESDFLDSDPSSLELIEAGLDKVTQIVQELSDSFDDLVSTATLTELEADIADLQDQIDDIVLDVTNAQNTILAHTSAISDINADILAIEGDIADLELAVGALQTTVGNQSTAILNIGTQISAINLAAAALDLRVSALESYFGGAGEVSILNNDTANIVGMLFNMATYDAVIIDFAIFRKTDANNKYSSGQIAVIYSTAINSWRIEKISEALDYSGVTFAVTALGQVSYTSSDITGVNYTGKMKYSIKKFEV